MRDFNFSDANTSAANIAGVRPVTEEVPYTENARRDEIVEDGAALSSFRRSDDEDEASDNTAKIAGAVLVGLLLVGGGIYAYESTLKNTAAPIAMNTKTPVQTNVAAATPAPADSTTPDTSPATAAPASSTPAPSVPARQTIRTARDTSTDNSVSTADASVNQPMTLTPDTAPPAQQSQSADQTAQIQQPITAPLASAQPAAPQPEVAANGSSGVTLPSDSADQNSTAQSNVPAQPPAAVQPPATLQAPLQTPAQ